MNCSVLAMLGPAVAERVQLALATAPFQTQKLAPTAPLAAVVTTPGSSAVGHVLAALAALSGGKARVVVHLAAIAAACPAYTAADVEACLRTLRAQGTKGARLVCHCGGGRWFVLPCGLAAAGIGPANAPTVAYLNENWNAIRERFMRVAPRRLRRSKDMQLIEDHLQQFAMTLLRRDTIGKRAAKGKKLPALGQVVAWGIHNSVTDIRTWGTDAVTRATRGALTEHGYAERQTKVFDAEVPFRDSFHSTPEATVYHTEEGHDDYYGGDARVDAVTDLFISEAMDIIEVAITNTLSNAPRYQKIARMLVHDGARVTDVAHAEDISVARATVLRQQLAAALHGAGVCDELGISPLRFRAKT